MLGWSRAEEGTREGRLCGTVQGAADFGGAGSGFLLADFGFDLGVWDVVRRRGVGQPLGHDREVFRVFQVFLKLFVGRGDEVREGVASLGVAAEQGLGSLA